MQSPENTVPPLNPHHRVPSPQARLEVNVTVLGDELVALRRERAELARGKAALQGEVCLSPASTCPSPVSLCSSSASICPTPGSSSIGYKSPVTPHEGSHSRTPFGDCARWVWGVRVTTLSPRSHSGAGAG